MGRKRMEKVGFGRRLRSLFGSLGGERASGPHRRRLALEALESRTLLAVVSITPAGGQWTTVERNCESFGFTVSCSAENGEDLSSQEGNLRVNLSIGGTAGESDFIDTACDDGEKFVYVPASGGSASFSVIVGNDALPEGDETIQVSLSSVDASGVTSDGGDGCGCCCGGGGEITYSVAPNQLPSTITIQDDDNWAIKVEAPMPNPVVERSGMTAYSISRVDNGSGRSGDLSYAIAVDFTMAGTADLGDYTLSPYWNVTIPADDGGTGVALTTNNDHVKESDETAILVVGTGQSVPDQYGQFAGGVYGADQAHGSASVIILDDDHWVVELGESGAVGDPRSLIQEEQQTFKTLTLSREHQVMVPVRTGDTTYGIDVAFAYDGLANGSDYVMIDQVVQAGGGTSPVQMGGETPSFEIQAGQTEKEIDVQAVDDTLIEHLYQLLSISITAATHGTESYQIGVLNTVELDIEDNDEPTLELVWYGGANPYWTDPVYLGGGVGDIERNKYVSEDNTWHWQRVPLGFDIRYPVTYERSTGAAESRFEVIAEWSGDVEDGYSMKVGATGPDGMTVPMTTANIDGSTINSTLIQSTGNPFPDTVKYYSDFKLTWKFTIEHETTARPAGENENEMYITYDVPALAPRHTSLHLGTVAANGDSDLTDVVNDAWGAFAGLAVDRRDGERMTYYGTTSPSSTLVGLLTSEDGECVAWANLLMDVLGAQGFATEGKVFSATNNAEGILINDYSGFDQEGSLEMAGANPIAYGMPSGQDLSNYTHLGRVVDPRIVAGDITDQAGLPGQGPNTDPVSYFEYHAIVRMGYDFIGDGDTEYRYFDPSYGNEYAKWASEVPCQYYSEAEHDGFAIDDFVSTALAGLYLRPSSGLYSVAINESVTGDVNGDGDTQNPEIVSPAILMREGDASDIELKNGL